MSIINDIVNNVMNHPSIRRERAKFEYMEFCLAMKEIQDNTIKRKVK